MNKAFFLDRDGVINVECNYLHEADKVTLLPQVADALKKIRAAGYLVIVTTNQSGIARGMYTLEDTEQVHRRINELLAMEGATIDGFYVCPHHPGYSGECDCRKPKPGLLLQAAKEHDINLAESVMVGDRMSDLNAGVNAGCASSILVETGYGQNQVGDAVKAGFKCATNLFEAVEMVLSESK